MVAFAAGAATGGVLAGDRVEGATAGTTGRAWAGAGVGARVAVAGSGTGRPCCAAGTVGGVAPPEVVASFGVVGARRGAGTVREAGGGGTCVAAGAGVAACGGRVFSDRVSSCAVGAAVCAIAGATARSEDNTNDAANGLGFTCFITDSILRLTSVGKSGVNRLPATRPRRPHPGLLRNRRPFHLPEARPDVWIAPVRCRGPQWPNAPDPVG